MLAGSPGWVGPSSKHTHILVFILWGFIWANSKSCLRQGDTRSLCNLYLPFLQREGGSPLAFHIYWSYMDFESSWSRTQTTLPSLQSSVQWRVWWNFPFLSFKVQEKGQVWGLSEEPFRMAICNSPLTYLSSSLGALRIYWFVFFKNTYTCLYDL